MARIRAAEWETENYWLKRISAYLAGEASPQKALAPRVVYIALADDQVAGFIAGHLTRRLQCEGELEWINVAAPWRGAGIAPELLRRLAAWFAAHNALKICVDPDDRARSFYLDHGARPLNRHWLVWDDIRALMAPAAPA